MFRLFKAELKKIFMKPSIFVVTALIITMLALSFFVFHPEDKKDYLDTYAPAPTGSQSFDNWYASGFNTAPTDELRNATAIKYLKDAEDSIDFYLDYDTETDGVVKLKNMWQTFQSAYDNFCQNYNTPESTDSDREALLTKINTFKTTYQNMLKSPSKIYFLVKTSSNQNIEDYLYKLSYVYTEISSNPTRFSTKKAKDEYVINQFRNSGILSTSKKTGFMENELNQIVQFAPNKNDIATLKTYINTARTRLLEQRDVIETYYAQNTGTGKAQQILKLRMYIADYKLTAKYAYDIVVNGSLIYGIPSSAENSLTSYKNFDNTNFYKIKITYSQTKYMFDNEVYEYDYGTPFSLSAPSNNSANGFDYSYFALRLCSLFITVYLVVLAAGTIAGEQNAGTLKLLAIRPLSRSKLLTGKSLAIFAIGGILLAVSSLASLVIGGVTYGLSSASIMTVFNGTTTIIISPILLYLIAFFTMYIEIVFYASLSIFISTAFKSNVGAVSISTLAFFVSTILNGILTNVPAMGFLPFTNISFFKYFGSAFMANTSDFLMMILSPGVFIGATFISSLIIYLITVSVLIYIPYLIFKNRDLK